MTNNIHMLRFDSIITDLKVTNKKQALQKLVEHTSRLIGTDCQYLFDSLMKHEKEQTSGIGNGIAIPHMKLPRLTKPMIIFAKLSRPVDFHSVDEEPVDMACMILSPEFEGAIHLRRLAKVSRFFNDKEFCNHLRNAQDADDIRLVLKNVNERKIAA